SAGTLIVTGSLSQVTYIAIGPSGNLAGNGTVGVIFNSGAVTPGLNGIGTLHAISFSNSDTFNAGFDGPNHGKIEVTRSAIILGGSTLNVLGTNFSVGRYSVLSGQDLSGTFTTFSAPASTVLSFSPEYSATDAYVHIGFATPFVPLAQNTNQRE